MIQVPLDRVIVNPNNDFNSIMGGLNVQPPALGQEIFRLLPEVTNTLFTTSSRSPVTIYAVNMCGVNNWVNAAFKDLLYICFWGRSRNNPTPFTILEGISLFSSYLVSSDQEVMRHIAQVCQSDPNILATINQNAPQYQRAVNQLHGFLRNTAQPQGYGNPQQQGFNNPQQQGFNNPQQQGFNNPQQQGFNNTQQQIGYQPGAAGPKDRFSKYGQNNKTQNVVNIASFTDDAICVPTGGVVGEIKNEAMPEIGEEVPPLIIEGVTERIKTINDNKYRWVVKSMKEDDHKLSFSNDSVESDLALQQLKSAVASSDDEFLELNLTNLHDAKVTLLCCLKKILQRTNSGIVYSKVSVVKPGILNDDDKELTGTSNTLSSICKTCDPLATAETMRDCIDSTGLDRLNELNQYLTDLVNHLVKVRLGIDNLKITDFKNDIVSVVELLNSKFSAVYVDVFNTVMGSALRSISSSIRQETIEGTVAHISSTNVDVIVEKTIVVSVKFSDDKFLSLNDLSNGKPKRITSKGAPEIHALATLILGSEEVSKFLPLKILLVLGIDEVYEIFNDAVYRGTMIVKQ